MQYLRVSGKRSVELRVVFLSIVRRSSQVRLEQ